MRILHTADWHLGRLFYQLHLTEDQAYLLDQFVALVRDVRPQVVLVSGDIYDRAVPPPEAVALLNDVFSRIVLDCAVPVIAIAGNHDSPTRLGFGSRLLAERGLHVIGPFSAQMQPLIIPDEHGAVRFYPVPYAEPAVMREALGDPALTTHETALRAWLGGIHAQRPPGQRSVLIGHAFVAGGETAEDSERPLSVGGTASVSTDVFAGFDYVALGHLHRPQTFAGDRLHYAGSLLQYSFAEADQPKSVSLVEMDAHGRCLIERIALAPRRAVRRISGLLHDLLHTPDPSLCREDYLEVTLLDRGAILDPMGKLREVYPNVLHMERPVLMGDGASAGPGIDHRALAPSELFAAFYAQVTGTPIEEGTAASFAALADQFALLEREALAV